MNRRDFSKKMIQTAATVLFVETLFGCSSGIDRPLAETNGIVAPKAAQHLNQWAVRLDEFCRDLRTEKLTLIEWQDRLGELFEGIDVDDLLDLINFENLTRSFELPDLGVRTKTFRFPAIRGLPDKTAFVKKLFGMKPERAIIPHGHSNMASGHLVLAGDFRLRQYDKISLEPNSITIRPTVDKTIEKGGFSSISDERNNVHWFIAGAKPAFTFDVIMLDLKDKQYDIHNVDMDLAKETSGGDLRVPLLDVKKALAKYGKIHHG